MEAIRGLLLFYFLSLAVSSQSISSCWRTEWVKQGGKLFILREQGKGLSIGNCRSPQNNKKKEKQQYKLPIQYDWEVGDWNTVCKQKGDAGVRNDLAEEEESRFQCMQGEMPKRIKVKCIVETQNGQELKEQCLKEDKHRIPGKK